MTKPNPENCKNCSSKCAYDCAQLQYTIQHRTVLIISLLNYLQTTIIVQMFIGREGVSVHRGSKILISRDKLFIHSIFLLVTLSFLGENRKIMINIVLATDCSAVRRFSAVIGHWPRYLEPTAFISKRVFFG